MWCSVNEIVLFNSMIFFFFKAEFKSTTSLNLNKIQTTDSWISVEHCLGTKSLCWGERNGERTRWNQGTRTTHIGTKTLCAKVWSCSGYFQWGIWGLSALLKGVIFVAVGIFVVLLNFLRLHKTPSTVLQE